MEQCSFMSSFCFFSGFVSYFVVYVSVEGFGGCWEYGDEMGNGTDALY